MINCIIVDDEPIARNGMLEYVNQVEFLYPVAVCKNAIEASAALQEHNVELVFLDIQMPKITGIDFLKNLVNPPPGNYYHCFPRICY